MFETKLAALGQIAFGEISARALHAVDHVRRIEKLAGLRPHFLQHAGLQVHHDGARHEAHPTALAQPAEERIGVSLRLLPIDRLAGRGVDAVLLTDGFPETGGDLIPGLADGDDDVVVNFHEGSELCGSV